MERALIETVVIVGLLWIWAVCCRGRFSLEGRKGQHEGLSSNQPSVPAEELEQEEPETAPLHAVGKG